MLIFTCLFMVKTAEKFDTSKYVIGKVILKGIDERTINIDTTVGSGGETKRNVLYLVMDRQSKTGNFAIFNEEGKKLSDTGDDEQFSLNSKDKERQTFLDLLHQTQEKSGKIKKQKENKKKDDKPPKKKNKESESSDSKEETDDNKETSKDGEDEEEEGEININLGTSPNNYNGFALKDINTGRCLKETNGLVEWSQCPDLGFGTDDYVWIPALYANEEISTNLRAAEMNNAVFEKLATSMKNKKPRSDDKEIFKVVHETDHQTQVQAENFTCENRRNCGYTDDNTAVRQNNSFNNSVPSNYVQSNTTTPFTTSQPSLEATKKHIDIKTSKPTRNTKIPIDTTENTAEDTVYENKITIDQESPESKQKESKIRAMHKPVEKSQSSNEASDLATGTGVVNVIHVNHSGDAKDKKEKSGKNGLGNLVDKTPAGALAKALFN